jgi:hypothetical protein
MSDNKPQKPLEAINSAMWTGDDIVSREATSIRTKEEAQKLVTETLQNTFKLIGLAPADSPFRKTAQQFIKDLSAVAPQITPKS